VGAAWALVVTGLAQGICYYIFSSKLYYIPYLMQHNLAILFVYLIVYLLSTQVDQSKIGFIFALQFKFLFCIFGFFVLWLVLRNGLNKHNRLAPIYVGGE